MTTEEYSFREQEAKRYKAALLLSGDSAAIYMEDINDKRFWNMVLQHYKTDCSFHFISGSRSSGSGCQHCLKYKDFLDNHFFIAIDSDYRYLLQEENIDMEHFIMQTYTYSFENHLCYDENLQRTLRQACDDQYVDELFSFFEFLKEYSEILYPLYLIFLDCLRTDNGLFSKDDFHSLLSLPPKINHSMENNGKAVLDILRQRVNEKQTELLNKLPDFSEDEESQRYASLGLRKETAYLYVRGHNLYNVIVSLGKEVIKWHISEKKKQAAKSLSKEIHSQHKLFEDVLFSQLSYDYKEMMHIGEDIDKLYYQCHND